MRIRNFSIIAHIDHGKSTLADRLLEATGTISSREMKAQIMDSMELERERGITIKAKAVRMNHTAADGSQYVLNLIDTPGHVDFTYEVSRALAACEGALLVVDASQGVEAQTLANADLAKQLNLTLIPVINKVDLPSANIEKTQEQIFDVLGITEDPVLVSAKAGIGTQEVLQAIVDRIPAPQGDPQAPLAATVFDSQFDIYRGVILFVRVVHGTIKAGMRVRFFSNQFEATVEEAGYFVPAMKKAVTLSVGEVGYLVCGIKDVHSVRVGDTLMEVQRPLSAPLPGYREAKPVVFAGVFPINPADYGKLKAALEKLNLEDSSFVYQVETSQALGFGFRLGFLGLLHMDIIKERLEREFDLSLIVTSPNVVFQVRKKGALSKSDSDAGSSPAPKNDSSSLPTAGRSNAEFQFGGTIRLEPGFELLDNPAKFPDYGDIESIREPFVSVTIVLPVEYQAPVMDLLKERRGEHRSVEYIAADRMIIRYNVPLAEIVLDFYDRLKSVSKGYASFDYNPAEFRESDLVRLEILIHGDAVDALSQIVHRTKAFGVGKALCEKLKELIPRQMFEVAIQARVDGRIIARETIPAARKDVLAKCYGGDITRKRKLLEKQKEGKKRAKQLGSVSIPQEAFLAVLKIKT